LCRIPCDHFLYGFKGTAFGRHHEPAQPRQKKKQLLIMPNKRDLPDEHY
jgi:hypothetical protein